jgi:hypothetical protein
MRQLRARKGSRETLGRVARLPFRYGVTPFKLHRQLQVMSTELNKRDITPTVHVTTSSLDAHPEIAADLKTMEVGLHGHYHVGYSGLTRERQAHDLDASREVAARLGFEVSGFRAPYLRADRTTLELLGERAFEYDSSFPAVIPIFPGTIGSRVERAITRRYGTCEIPPEVGRADGLPIEVPVSLPDDEILLDAMGIRSPAVLRRVFESMARSAAESQSALVLQVHPERFGLCAGAIYAVIDLAAELGGWKATIGDIARWERGHVDKSQAWPDGRTFAIAISGDLDAVCLQDFRGRLRRRLKWES